MWELDEHSTACSPEKVLVKEEKIIYLRELMISHLHITKEDKLRKKQSKTVTKKRKPLVNQFFFIQKRKEYKK